MESISTKNHISQNRRARLRLVLGLTAVALLAVIGWLYWPAAEPVEPPVPMVEIPAESEIAPTAFVAPPMVPPEEAPVGRSAPVAPDPSTAEERLQGTSRMIAAHASLRVPEVADPESVTNRQTLQQLVAMAKAKQTPEQ